MHFVGLLHQLNMKLAGGAHRAAVGGAVGVGFAGSLVAVGGRAGLVAVLGLGREGSTGQ